MHLATAPLNPLTKGAHFAEARRVYSDIVLSDGSLFSRNSARDCSPDLTNGRTHSFCDFLAAHCSWTAKKRQSLYYFLRLVIAAFATELISALASWQLPVIMPERNALFTYAAGIAMLAGMSMTVGCYHDLVAHVIPADGKWDRKTLFGVPINPATIEYPLSSVS